MPSSSRNSPSASSLDSSPSKAPQGRSFPEDRENEEVKRRLRAAGKQATSTTGSALGQELINVLLRLYSFLRLDLNKGKTASITFIASVTGVGTTRLRELVEEVETSGHCPKARSPHHCSLLIHHSGQRTQAHGMGHFWRSHQGAPCRHQRSLRRGGQGAGRPRHPRHHSGAPASSIWSRGHCRPDQVPPPPRLLVIMPSHSHAGTP